MNVTEENCCLQTVRYFAMLFVMDKNISVKYLGEFVLSKNGNIDFGEISEEISKIIRRQKGKIRLRIGKENKGERGNYGEKHIERVDRIQQLKSAGFENARDFVEFIASDFDSVYKGKGTSLIICKRTKVHNILYITLEPSATENYYDVKSCLLSRESYLKNKTPLWRKPTDGV